MTVLWCQWEVGKQAAQNFLFSSAFPWILNLVSVKRENLAVQFCAAASAQSQQSIFFWQWTWVFVCTFLPKAEKLLLTKTKQTLFKLTRVAVNLLVICQHCEPLDAVSYPWQHWSPFEHFRKCFKFPYMGLGFVSGGSFQVMAFHHFSLEKSWNSLSFLVEMTFHFLLSTILQQFSFLSQLCPSLQKDRGFPFSTGTGDRAQSHSSTPQTHPCCFEGKTIFSVDISKAALCTRSQGKNGLGWVKWCSAIASKTPRNQEDGENRSNDIKHGILSYESRDLFQSLSALKKCCECSNWLWWGRQKIPSAWEEVMY